MCRFRLPRHPHLTPSKCHIAASWKFTGNIWTFAQVENRGPPSGNRLKEGAASDVVGVRLSTKSHQLLDHFAHGGTLFRLAGQKFQHELAVGGLQLLREPRCQILRLQPQEQFDG